MFRTIRNAALSALVALGALAAIPASAQAGNLYLGFGSGYHGPSVGFHFGSPPRHYRGPARHVCSPREAVAKASRFGVRSAHVRQMNHRVIHVAGRDRGRPVTVSFWRAPGCPVVR